MALGPLFLFRLLFRYIPALPLSLLGVFPDVALFGHICFGLGPVELRWVWCHALFKGKAMRTGWKGACCGLTSKPLSRTADDCHPWHSNLCHGQMTTFILSVDRHVILKSLGAGTALQKSLKDWFSCCSVSSHLPRLLKLSHFHYYLDQISAHSENHNFVWFWHCGYLLHNWVKPDTIVGGIEKMTEASSFQPTWTNKHDRFFYGSAESHAAQTFMPL